MKHVEDLIAMQTEHGSPGQYLGRFLLHHSNSPEYLVAQLQAYLEAVQADLDAERARFRNLSGRKLADHDKVVEFLDRVMPSLEGER